MKLFLFAFLLSTQVYANPQIKVHSLNFVHSDVIKLKQIAVVQGFGKEKAKKINEISFGNSPRGREEKSLTNFGISEVLRFSLKKILGESYHDVRLTIPRKVTVRSAERQLNAENIKNKIINWISEGCGDCQVSFNTFELYGDMPEEYRDWELKKPYRHPRGHFNLSVRILKSTSWSRSLWVKGDLRILQKVPVAVRNLPSGSKIQKGDYKIILRDVTYERNTAPSESELLGSQTTRPIQVQQPLWKDHLQRRHALLKGQLVNVQVENNNWKVQLKGVAQNNGYVGDLIKVLNPDTQKVITGVISKEGKVVVQ